MAGKDMERRLGRAPVKLKKVMFVTAITTEKTESDVSHLVHCLRSWRDCRLSLTSRVERFS